MRGCQAIRAGDGKLLWQFDEWVLEGDE